MTNSGKRLIVIITAIVLLAAVLGAGCTSPPAAAGNQSTATVPVTTTPVPHKPGELLIATTTSLYDTGLLNQIQDLYQNKTGISVKITSQGTGIAIQVAKRGDADLLLVHSPLSGTGFHRSGIWDQPALLCL